MILKIEREEQNGYHYFEMAHLDYYVSDMETVKNYDSPSIMWLCNENNFKNDKLLLKVITVRHYDKPTDERLIITPMTCYVLNDGGKTIERL